MIRRVSTARPWHWLPGCQPALRYSLRSPRLVSTPGPDRLLDRLAEHGPDPALAGLALTIESEGRGENRVKKGDEARVARQRLTDLARRSRLPDTAMGRAASAWGRFGEFALAWAPPTDDAARRWLVQAECLEDPVGAWRRWFNGPGGLAEQLDDLLEVGEGPTRFVSVTLDPRLLPGDGREGPTRFVSVTLDERLLPGDGREGPTVRVSMQIGGFEPAMAQVDVPLRRLETFALEARVLLGFVRLLRHRRFPRVGSWTIAGRNCRPLVVPGEQACLASRSLALWRALVATRARSGDILFAARPRGGSLLERLRNGLPDATAIFAAGRWWMRGDAPPVESVGSVGLSAVVGAEANVADAFDVHVADADDWRWVGAAVMASAAPMFEAVCVRTAGGTVLGTVRQPPITPSGPETLLWDLAVTDPWEAAGRVIHLLHRRVPGAVAARPGSIVWPAGGGVLPLDDVAPAEAEASRLVADAIEQGLVERAAVHPTLLKARARPEPVVIAEQGPVEIYRDALAAVRDAYSADYRGRLSPKSGHGVGRPPKKPSVEDVLAAQAEMPGATVKALAKALGCDRSKVGRRLTTAGDEARLVIELLVAGGLDAEAAAAALEAGRAADIEEARGREAA